MVGIIFDIDGTLWDSTEVVAESWNRAIQEKSSIKKIVTAEELKALFGRPVNEIIENVFPMLSDGEQKELGRYCIEYENLDVKKKTCHIYEKVSETINRLYEKYPLFIVSNCEDGYIEAFLENTGLFSCFKDFLCPGKSGKGKGDNIRLIMERNQLDAAVYVGDTQGDLDACYEAGVPMIYAAYGFGSVEDKIPSINYFSELKHIDFEKIVEDYKESKK